jgi:hypothetical protein
LNSSVEQLRLDGMFSETKQSSTFYSGNSVHTDTLSVGAQFQDFIMDQSIKKLGLALSIYQSKKYQYTYGESRQGFEIKYDARSTGDCTYYDNTATGNVGIEVAEKTHKQNYEWVPSGIYRNDNTWMYVVGNYHQAWFFSKKILKMLHESNRYRTCNTLPTIQTMLLPLEDADKYCAIKLQFDNV